MKATSVRVYGEPCQFEPRVEPCQFELVENCPRYTHLLFPLLLDHTERPLIDFDQCWRVVKEELVGYRVPLGDFAEGRYELEKIDMRNKTRKLQNGWGMVIVTIALAFALLLGFASIADAAIDWHPEGYEDTSTCQEIAIVVNTNYNGQGGHLVSTDGSAVQDLGAGYFRVSRQAPTNNMRASFKVQVWWDQDPTKRNYEYWVDVPQGCHEVVAKGEGECRDASSEWHWVITGLGSIPAPVSIQVTWPNGLVEIIPLKPTPSAIGHYEATTFGPLGSIPVAVSMLPNGWTGQFNLSHRPCPNTPTVTPTPSKTSTQTPSPTATATPSRTPSPTNTPSSTSTKTSTSTATSTASVSSTATSTATGTPTASASATPTATATSWFRPITNASTCTQFVLVVQTERNGEFGRVSTLSPAFPNGPAQDGSWRLTKERTTTELTYTFVYTISWESFPDYQATVPVSAEGLDCSTATPTSTASATSTSTSTPTLTPSPTSTTTPTTVATVPTEESGVAFLRVKKIALDAKGIEITQTTDITEVFTINIGGQVVTLHAGESMTMTYVISQPTVIKVGEIDLPSGWSFGGCRILAVVSSAQTDTQCPDIIVKKDTVVLLDILNIRAEKTGLEDGEEPKQKKVFLPVVQR